MFAAPCSGKNIRIIAMALVMALCLPLLTVALAAAVPSAPESLTAVAGNGKVTLVWFEPESDGGAAIASYEISIDGGTTWTDLGLATTYTYDGLAGGKQYVFMVRALNSAGSGDEAIANAKPKDGGAEATPTPAPAPTGGLDALIDSWFGATPTPGPAGNGTGTGTGGGQGTGGGGGGGGGQQVEPPKPPDIPNPPDKPQDKPHADPPPPEENIPIEIDPADVTEKPLKPKKEKVQKAVTVWTITADGTQAAGDKQPTPNTPVRFDFTLEMKATKAGETIYGDYTGAGSLNASMDSAFYATGMQGFSGEWDHNGPLTDIRFTLEKVKGEPDAKYKQAMEEYNQAYAEYWTVWLDYSNRLSNYAAQLTAKFSEAYPGVQFSPDPELREARDAVHRLWYEDIEKWKVANPEPVLPKKPQNKNAYYAKGKGTMLWNPETVKNLFIDFKGEVIPEVGNERHWPPLSLEFEVIIYANGNGVVKFSWGWNSDTLIYKAHLIKSVQMVDVD